MLRWVIRRFHSGKPVLRNDLLRLVALADDLGGSDGGRA
jgi:hypothetical protein